MGSTRDALAESGQDESIWMLLRSWLPDTAEISEQELTE
jgi:hypothetical protein